MQRQLNANGVWVYRQLAGLNPDEVEMPRRALGAPPGRIERNRRVEHAQALHRRKYGRARDGPPG